METILNIFALAGTAVFAVSGALLALRKGMDIVGVSFIATVTGVGGGTIRDLLLGATPVAWVTDPTEIAICIGCAFVLSLFNKALLGRRMTWLLYADAAGLALFAVLGAAKADAAGAAALVAILFGAMSASFGGVIRDIICGEEPVLFRKEIYITAALLGGAVYVLTPEALGFDLRALAGVVAALALRLLAMRFEWTLPFPRYGGR
ncbi:MAG: trimeric intracellular cation channel family protein [Pseudomonadota bacterium]